MAVLMVVESVLNLLSAESSNRKKGLVELDPWDG